MDEEFFILFNGEDEIRDWLGFSKNSGLQGKEEKTSIPGSEVLEVVLHSSQQNCSGLGRKKLVCLPVKCRIPYVLVI